MPIVMFADRPFSDGGGRFRGVGNMQVTAFRSIEKSTGKLKLDETDLGNNVMFQALNMDLRAGKIELIAHNLKIVHYLPNYDAAAAKDAKPATQQDKRSGATEPGRRFGGGGGRPVPVQVIEK